MWPGVSQGALKFAQWSSGQVSRADEQTPGREDTLEPIHNTPDVHGFVLADSEHTDRQSHLVVQKPL